MHDAAGVRVSQCAGDLAQHADRLADRQLATARQASAQRFAIDERHGEVGKAVGLARGEHRDDVRVLQLGGEADLALEPLDRDLARHGVGQDLDHHLPLERMFLGDEHARHAATAELPLDAVAAGKRRGEASGHRGWGRGLAGHSINFSFRISIRNRGSSWYV